MFGQFYQIADPVDRYTCAEMNCSTIVVLGTDERYHSRDVRERLERRLCTACWELRIAKEVQP